jgi:hypothetical protein
MAIDPNIALGVRPIEIANPLAQYGQVAQLQAAQNQNQLAQLQMREAEATAQERNALRQLNPSAPDYEQQLFRVNPQLGIAYRKEASAAAAQEATRKKTAVETTGLEFNQRLDKANKAISDIAALNSPQEAMASIDQHLANGDIDQQKADMLKGQLAQAPSFGAWQKGMLVNILDAKDRLTQTSPKPVQVKRADGSIIFLDENPNSPTFQKEVLPAQATGMTPYEKGRLNFEGQRVGLERQRLAQDATSVVYQEDGNGNIVALPSRLKAGEVPTGRMAVAPGGGFQPMMAKPSEAVGKEQMSINQQKSTVQGALDAVKATPDAFGWATGNLPESVRSRLATSDENEARAFVFNVVSGVIKERAGTAQSAGEAATLARFLPAEGDNAKVIEDKLTGFQKYLNAKESGTTKKRSGDVSAKPAAANPYSAMSNEDLLKALRGN